MLETVNYIGNFITRQFQAYEIPTSTKLPENIDFANRVAWNQASSMHISLKIHVVECGSIVAKFDRMKWERNEIPCFSSSEH